MKLGIETAPFYSFPGSVKAPEPLQSKAFTFWMWESFILGFWPKITSFRPEVHVSWIYHPMSNDRHGIVQGFLVVIRLNPELIPTIWRLSWFPFSTARGNRPIICQPTFTGCCIHQTHQDWKSYIPRVQVARRRWHHLGTDSHFLSTKTFSLQLSGNTWKVGCRQMTSTEHKLTQMKRTAVRSNLAAIHIHMHSRIADFDITKRERGRERDRETSKQQNVKPPTFCMFWVWIKSLVQIPFFHKYPCMYFSPTG